MPLNFGDKWNSNLKTHHTAFYNKNMENLNKDNLKKIFRRLRDKKTKKFAALIVRDPLDFIDFEVNLEENIRSLIYEIDSGLYHPQRPYLHPSGKSKGINRPTVVFDIKDALVYRFCIEQIESDLLKKTRQKNIRGGIRIAPRINTQDGDFYEVWFEDWLAHLNAIKDSLSEKNYLVSADIASYFENINILLLKDLVKGAVGGKNEIINLLFYFLENVRFRGKYELNTYVGLPQEDIDCSRLLAYFFLNSHDNNMVDFCRNSNKEYFRFVDDMFFVLNTEIDGKWALKAMTESLRKLNLVASLEKTKIMSSDKAYEEFFFTENLELTYKEKILRNAINNNENVEEHIEEIIRLYEKYIEDGRESFKNWVKILKRFYTIFSYTKSDYLFDYLIDHIMKYPTLLASNKIQKYILGNIESNNFNTLINKILDYLYSSDNIYPDVETNILETLLLVDNGRYSKYSLDRLKKLGCDILFTKNNYKKLSNYAKAISCLLVYKFSKDELEGIVDHYLSGHEDDYLVRKYLIFVLSTIVNRDLNAKVLEKARREQNVSISRLVKFIENIKEYRNCNVVKNYLSRNKCTLIYDNDIDLTVTIDIVPIRSQILKDIINIYR